MIKSGNVQFNPEAFKDYSFEQFKAEFKGKLAEDAKQLFEKIKIYNDLEDCKKLDKESEFLNQKDWNEVVVPELTKAQKELSNESNSKPSTKGKKY